MRHPDPVVRARLTDAREIRADATMLARLGRHLQAVPLLHDAALSLALAVAHLDRVETPPRATLGDVLARLEGRNSLPAIDEITLDRMQLAYEATRAMRANEASDLARRAEIPPNAFAEAERGLRGLEDWAQACLLRAPEPQPEPVLDPEPEDDPFLF